MVTAVISPAVARHAASTEAEPSPLACLRVDFDSVGLLSNCAVGHHLTLSDPRSPQR